MPVDESGFAHIRVPEPHASRLRALAGLQKRSTQAEGMMAVETYLLRFNEPIDAELKRLAAAKKAEKKAARK